MFILYSGSKPFDVDDQFNIKDIWMNPHAHTYIVKNKFYQYLKKYAEFKYFIIF